MVLTEFEQIICDLTCHWHDQPWDIATHVAELEIVIM